MSQRIYDNGIVLWSFADLDRIKVRFPHIRSKRGLASKWHELRAVGILENAGHHDCTGLSSIALSNLGRIRNAKALVRLARKLLRLDLGAKEAERFIYRWRQEDKDRRLLATALRLQPQRP